MRDHYRQNKGVIFKMTYEHQIFLTLRELQKIDDVLYKHAWDGGAQPRDQAEIDFIHELWKKINSELMRITGKDKVW
jgi:hypothetical protein